MIDDAFNKKKPYHTIFVDYKSGNPKRYQEVTKAIAGIGNPIKTRKICLTSRSQYGDTGKLMQYGYDAYLLKPVKQNDLKTRLLNIMDTKKNETISYDNEIIGKPFVDEIKPNKFRALVVDDNKVNRKLMVFLLSKLKINCDTAENGMFAVEAFRKRNYDLILMDCLMPEMDGFEAVRNIRSIEKKQNISHTPVIATTADAFQETREKCELSGMDNYLTKPIAFKKLESIIGKYLNNA